MITHASRSLSNAGRTVAVVATMLYPLTLCDYGGELVVVVGVRNPEPARLVEPCQRQPTLGLYGPGISPYFTFSKTRIV